MKNKHLVVLAITLVLALGINGAAQAFGGDANSVDIVVDGANDPSIDIEAIQNAIDAVGEAGGGTVVLKGEFDFGAYGRVTIPYDNVTLAGERKGNPSTLAA